MSFYNHQMQHVIFAYQSWSTKLAPKRIWCCAQSGQHVKLLTKGSRNRCIPRRLKQTSFAQSTGCFYFNSPNVMMSLIYDENKRELSGQSTARRVRTGLDVVYSYHLFCKWSLNSHGHAEHVCWQWELMGSEVSYPVQSSWTATWDPPVVLRELRSPLPTGTGCQPSPLPHSPSPSAQLRC